MGNTNSAAKSGQNQTQQQQQQRDSPSQILNDASRDNGATSTSSTHDSSSTGGSFIGGSDVVREPPSLKTVLDELKDQKITVEMLERLFKRCCFMEIESFFDKYPSEDTLKCQFETRNKSSWFFTCLTCTNTDSSCFCSTCFFNGPHIDENHSFTVAENSSAVCDCGNAESVNPHGFCIDHQNVDEDNQIKQFRSVQPFVQKDLHLFFRYIFAYLQRVTTMTADFDANKTNIETILEWLAFLASRSSILIHIISQEVSSQRLDYNNFDLNSPLPLPYATNDNVMLESHHFLSYIFRRPNLLEYFLDLLTLLIDNHRLFRFVLFEEYLKNYVDIFTPRDTLSTEITMLIGSFYLETSSILIPFTTGLSSNNYLEIIFKTHKDYMKLLEPFYKSDKQIEKEVMLQTDMICVPKLFKNKQVGKYFTEHDNMIKLYLEFALALHNFTSPQFVDPTITTTCFLVSLEHKLMSSIKNLVEAQKPEKPEVPAKLALHIISHINKLVYPPLYERNGLKLPHQDFFQKFKYSEIPVHFPLYRMLCNVILEGNYGLIDTIKSVYTTEDVVNMVNTVLLFRVCYISYDPSYDPKENLLKSQQSTEFLTDPTMMCDLFALQVGLMILGPRHYLHTFFNVITSVDIYNNSTAFNELFALLISSFQVRGTVNPTDEEIKYHMIQVISSGFFILENLKLGFIFKETPPARIKKIIDEVSIKKDQIRVLKDEYWKDVDLFYPFLSLKYKNILKSRTIQNYKDYQKRHNIPDSFPIPPTLTPLKSEFKGVQDVFDDPTLFEIVFAVLLEFLHNEYIGYDDSFDLLPVIRLLLKKTDIVANDFLYILASGLKTFHDEHLPKMEDKEEIQAAIDNLFKLDNKLEWTTPRNLSVFNVIKKYNVQLSVGNEKKPTSMLDLLVEVWHSTKQALNVEKKAVLRYIFVMLGDFNANIKQYIKEAGVELESNQASQEELDQKKSISDKRKKILEQMRQQQQYFLSAAEGKLEPSSPSSMTSTPPTIEKLEEKLVIGESEEGTEEKVVEKLIEVTEKVEQVKEGDDTTTTTTTSTTTTSDEKVENVEEKVEEETTTTTEPPKIVIEPSTSTKEESEESEHEHDEDEHEEVATKPIAIMSPPNPSLLKIKEIFDDDDEHVHQEPVNLDECCIICQTGKEQEILYSIGYIDITSTSQLHNKLEVERHIADETLPDAYVNFLDEYYYNEINPGSLPYLPNKGDEPSLFACFLFYRSASTYISSCSHNVHQTCLRKLHPSFEDGFSCPLCSLPSNVIIPLTIDNTIESLEARKLFFTALCKFDFFLFMNKENATIIERYMWKYVLQNIETLELKSRKTSLYSDTPYYLMKQNEFNKELATLKRLFNVIMACNVPPIPEGHLPMESSYLFLMDPFIASTYQVYLSNCDPFNCIAHGYTVYLFNMLIMHMMRTLGHADITKKSLTNFINDLKTNGLSPEAIEEFNDQILPYLRKMYLFREFYLPAASGDMVISLENFSDFTKMKEYLNVNSIDKFISAMDFAPLIDHYCVLTNTPKGSKFVGVYPPPSSFKHLPKFINLPERYIDFLRMNLDGGHCEHCKNLKKSVCMFCGLRFCISDNCKGSSFIHSYRCPNTPFGLFMCIDNPLVKVLKEEHGKTSSFYPFGIYLNPHGVECVTPDTSLTLSKKKLKNLYKHWMNSNNSRKFN